MALFCADDFECNPFFRTLQSKYAAKYNEAQKKLWLICVPSHRSLKGLKIDKEFIDSHVLKPSPFFKSHFVSTDGNNSKSFEVEDCYIKTPTGMVKVLMEESAYNEDYKPFKILIIEKPLCSSSHVKEETHDSSTSSKNPKLLLAECTAYLQTIPDSTAILEVLDKKIGLFNSSYMILPQYLQDAATKLQGISKWTLEEFLKTQTVSFDESAKLEIAACIENYLLCHVHQKLFPVIKKSCFDEDKKLTEKLLSLYEAQVTPDQLGVKEPFCCQTPSAVVELASLNSKTSPTEKLHCLKTTLKLLNRDIEHFLSETQSPVNCKKVNPCITSDDLIPLLVGLIIQSRPQYLASNLSYIQNFCWEISAINEFSFTLVTFQAAKEFLKSNEFDVKPSARKMKKELSLEELMEVTVEMQNNSKCATEAKSSHWQSPIDHQLENVTKMIEASTREHRESSNATDTTSLKRSEKQLKTNEGELGDFLSNLCQSSLGLTYGKQT